MSHEERADKNWIDLTIFHLYFDSGVSKKDKADSKSEIEEVDDIDEMEDF